MIKGCGKFAGWRTGDELKNAISHNGEKIKKSCLQSHKSSKGESVVNAYGKGFDCASTSGTYKTTAWSSVPTNPFIFLGFHCPSPQSQFLDRLVVDEGEKPLVRRQLSNSADRCHALSSRLAELMAGLEGRIGQHPLSGFAVARGLRSTANPAVQEHDVLGNGGGL